MHIKKSSLWKRIKGWWSRIPPGYHRLVLDGMTDGENVFVRARCTNIWCTLDVRNLEKLQSIDWEKLSRGCREGVQVFIPPDLSKLGKVSVIRNLPWMK